MRRVEAVGLVGEEGRQGPLDVECDLRASRVGRGSRGFLPSALLPPSPSPSCRSGKEGVSPRGNKEKVWSARREHRKSARQHVFQSRRRTPVGGVGGGGRGWSFREGSALRKTSVDAALWEILGGGRRGICSLWAVFWKELEVGGA